jgi:phosphoglycolate phosphatase
VIQNILFDLDGTLTDSAEGITQCLRHAVVSLGHRSTPREELAAHIGTPLRDIFVSLLGTSEPSRIDSAVELYREHFARVGLRENRVYAGVADTLATLRERGYLLFVATAKGQVDATRVVEHFELDHYFDAVFGVTTDNERSDKAELVMRIVRECRLDPAATAMIGDRSHDMHCARRANLHAVGADWGYGTTQELLDSGARSIARHPGALLDEFPRR